EASKSAKVVVWSKVAALHAGDIVLEDNLKSAAAQWALIDGAIRWSLPQSVARRPTLRDLFGGGSSQETLSPAFIQEMFACVKLDGNCTPQGLSFADQVVRSSIGDAIDSNS